MTRAAARRAVLAAGFRWTLVPGTRGVEIRRVCGFPRERWDLIREESGDLPRREATAFSVARATWKLLEMA